MSFYDEFLKAANDEQNGKITRDELLSITKKLIAETMPNVSEDKLAELAEAALDPTKSVVVVTSSDGPAYGESLPSETIHNETTSEEKKMSISLETQARCEELLARVDELMPPVDSVRLKPSRGKTTVFSSKMGGVPYFPKSMKYPTVSGGDCDGAPLRFLAQLNFEELPKLPGFPTEGILQFFAGYGGGRDDVYGMNFDDGQKQDTWRVIYHEKIITDESCLISEEDMPKIDREEGDYPFVGEFKLTAENVEPMPLSSVDFRFEKAATAAYNEIFGGDIIGLWDSKGGKGLCQVDEPLYDAIFTRDGSKTRMGGYPAFTQEDPRGYNDEYAKCTVLLFQSDSENGGNDENNWDDEIMWGDCGVANFFISPEDLAKRDFSHVLYNWDCG